jgi:opacity protein-like surface antigen
LNEWFGIVGEVGGNYKTFEDNDVSAAVFSFMGGPRFAVRTNPRFTPFGQFLGGARRRSVSSIGESFSIT